MMLSKLINKLPSGKSGLQCLQYISKLYILLFFMGWITIESQTNVVEDSIPQLNNDNIISPKAIKGVLDLKEWDFAKQGSIELSGEWEFFWKEIRDPQNMKDIKIATASETREELSDKKYFNVPNAWNGSIVNNESIGSDGFATFRLKVLLPESSKPLGFHIYDGQGSAYTMYMNDKLVAKNGSPSSEQNLEKAIYIPQYGVIENYETNSILVTMIVSNHIHQKGGFQTPVTLDIAEKIIAKKNMNTFLQIFLFGVLLIIALYHFSLFIYRKKDKSALWFGLLCLVMVLRLVCTGERLFMQMFPDLPFSLLLRMEYFGFYALVPPFFLFLNSLFPLEFTTIVRKTFIILPSVFIAIVLLTPIKVFTSTLFVFHLIVIFAMVYITFVLLKAVRLKRKGAKLILLGFFAYFFAGLNDLIFHNFLIGFGLILPFGLFFFIFAQAGALAHRIGDAFNTSEELSSELEEKVNIRTKDLESKKQEILELNHFTHEINSQVDLDSILEELSSLLFNKYGILGSWLLLPNESKEFLSVSRFRFFASVDDHVKEYLNHKIIPIKEEGGFIYKVYKRGKTFYLNKIPKFKYQIDKEIAENVGFDSFLLVPLMRNSQCIGLLSFTNFKDSMNLDKDDITKISNICSQISGAIDNNHLIALVQKEKEIANNAKLESEKQKKITEQLNLLIKSLNEDLNLNTIMKKVSEYIRSNYNIEYHGLSTLDHLGENLIYAHSLMPDFVSHKEREVIEKLKIPLKESLGTHAIAFKYNRPIFAQRIKQSALSPEEEIIHKILKFESILVIPLILQNKPIGYINLYNVGKIFINKEQITYLSILGEQLAGIVYSSKLYKEVEKEKSKSDKLLLNILPSSVANELKETNQVKPQYFESVSVLFTDFVGFTKISENLSPEELVQELDGCFSQFDEISNHFNLEKLKTIGDAYMCAGGLPISNRSHPIDVCLAALEFRSFMLQMSEIKKALGLPFWELRIGIHSGPVTAGVIGNNKFTYDIWGDTVNTASRMESSGKPGKINISGETYNKIKDFFDCEYRGKIEAKGKGEVDMYFLLKIKKEFSLDEDGLVPNQDLLNHSKDLVGING
ncbi:Adenylate/guanylate cyclase [Leptospira biflexa serovar Patoc strain 'Patoc 1 (Ames)']|uniref:Adenylate cyclase n=1 Tax=Leptospira biflexa serovar Patoc (strain Patoc 1 / ATCC 23582 / Paris) TaxID=456481 RepID=B0SLM3_LEPBP|nr:Adenylate/guanylate cyclase [Leptospira biflexa serovar Patoc strain 'Patoc 1 (Ames)']ABZ98609.1 Putative adenylate cyclase; putative membrane protein [Leptospira biflexa serovar Patoc strain 'Patoc 1 (Paris)']